jgi:hypothetical protein
MTPLTPEELAFRQSLKDKPNPPVKCDANLLREIGFQIAQEVKKATAPLQERITRLEKQIEQIERRKYVGVWASGKYFQGQLCTFDGSMWHCNVETTQRPGTGPDWTLAIKRGQNGRDGVDAHRRPTMQRTV